MQFSHFILIFFLQIPVYVNILNKSWKNVFNQTVKNIFHAAVYTANERPCVLRFYTKLQVSLNVSIVDCK
jgi:hypothetical protein